MRKLHAVIFLSSFFLASCSLLSVFGERESFVRVQGTHFTIDGKPYYYAGANMWYGCYLGSPGVTGNRERLKRELDSLSAFGITNLRVLAASEESYLQRSVKPGIQITPGVVNDSLLEGLDFLLAEMGKRKMRAVLFLNNYWEWSGGMAQYNAWTGGTPADPEDPKQGWGAFMDFSATFYTNAAGNELYRAYMKRVITRKNSINGRMYADDPTIMSWQLANEPRPGRDNELGVQNLPAFYTWIEETAKYIRSLDTNHLISTGSEGTVGTLQSPEYFLASHKTPHIDYLTMHLWPLNWGWFNPKKFEETLPPTQEKALNYIAMHCRLARTLGKPMVMEEFGLGRDNGEFLPGMPTTARDRYFALIYRTLYDTARTGGPIAGSNVWAWGGEGRAMHPDGRWRPGDPFVGDPPQEPQGVNSVFLGDNSTLAILIDHARKMQKLGRVDSLLVAR